MKLLWNYKALSFNQEIWQNKIFPQHHWLLKQINIIKPKNILEVGCGFGRNLEFLIKKGIDPKDLTAVDFSLIMLKKAKKKLNNKVKLINASAKKLPFKDNQFDLVFTHGVLMHLPPKKLEKALSELTRVSRQWLILIEEVRSKPAQLNYFTWAHDYEKIIHKLRLKVINKYSDKKNNLVWYLLNTTTKKSSLPKS